MDTNKMNDFDFEELDNAVNTLASKTQDEHRGPSEPPKPALPARPAPKAESLKITSEPEIPAPTSAPQLVRPAAPRTPRRGAFMDIMPPSPRKTNTRVGPTLQPLNPPEQVKPEAIVSPVEPPQLEPETAPADLHDPEPIPDAPVQPEAPKLERIETPEEKEDAVRWPDPLDFHVDSILEDETIEKPAQTSPFLAEAKVEKRPLGAFSNYKPTEEPPKPRADSAETLDSSEPSVDELTPDAEGTYREPEAPAEESSKDELAPQQSVESVENNMPRPEAREEPSRPDMHSAAMMSIPQQYRTEDKPADKATRSIFDTKEYHPPLLDATITEHHGGSMWMKLFVALVVLVLLGVAGYFTYLIVFANR
jgi:hypothetical protein